jgi:transcription initiation factor IIF auxiliary subunit
MTKKKAPTIDERLLALNKELEGRLEARFNKTDERLDALTQSLELIAHMQMATDRQIDKVEKQVEKVEKQIDRFVMFAQAIIERFDKRITKLERGE